MKKIILRTLYFFLKGCVLAAILYGLVCFGKYAYHFGYSLYSEKGYEEAPGKDATVVISPGMSGMKVAEMLEHYGIVEDKYVFFVQEKISDDKVILPGDYVLNSSMNPQEILQILTGSVSEEEL